MVKSWDSWNNWPINSCQYSFFCSASKNACQCGISIVERNVDIWQQLWLLCVTFTTRKITILNRLDDEKSFDIGCNCSRIFSALFMWNGRKMPFVLLC